MTDPTFTTRIGNRRLSDGSRVFNVVLKSINGDFVSFAARDEPCALDLERCFLDAISKFTIDTIRAE